LIHASNKVIVWTAHLAPPAASSALPVLDLSEGPHLGYAIQWFFYAALVFFGYPVYLRKQADVKALVLR
jgi:cytochrome oxidase assembly protein ShyY1